MLRLDQRQQETRSLMEQLVLVPSPATVSPVQAELMHREVTSLLMELLQATQPEPLQEIARLSGLPLPSPSPLVSES